MASRCFMVCRDGVMMGPFSARDLRRQAANGELQPDDRIHELGTRNRCRAWKIEKLRFATDTKSSRVAYRNTRASRRAVDRIVANIWTVARDGSRLLCAKLRPKRNGFFLALLASTSLSLTIVVGLLRHEEQPNDEDVRVVSQTAMHQSARDQLRDEAVLPAKVFSIGIDNPSPSDQVLHMEAAPSEDRAPSQVVPLAPAESTVLEFPPNPLEQAADEVDVDAVVAMASDLWKLEHYREALDGISTALVAKQDDVLYAARGQIYYALQQYELAQNDFEQAYLLAPRNVDVMVKLAATMLCLEPTNQDLPIVLLDQALARFPEHLDALTFRAVCALRSGDRAKAKACLKAALRIDPTAEFARATNRELMEAERDERIDQLADVVD